MLDWKLQLVGYPGEVMTDMDNSIYPDGFYQVHIICMSQSLAAWVASVVTWLCSFLVRDTQRVLAPDPWQPHP